MNEEKLDPSLGLYNTPCYVGKARDVYDLGFNRLLLHTTNSTSFYEVKKIENQCWPTRDECLCLMIKQEKHDLTKHYLTKHSLTQHTLILNTLTEQWCV